MKFIICLASFTLLFVTIFGVVTEQQRERLRRIAKKCRTEVGVSEERLQDFKTGKIEADDLLKKHVLCACKETGLMKQSGEIDEDVVKNQVKKAVADNEEEVERVMGKCAVKKETPEDTAAHLVGCLKSEAPNFVPIN